jgi:beta-1,4-mannosyltransferase
MIHVYPLPPQLPNNPYLDQLYGPLHEFDISIERPRARYILPALLLGQGRRVLHLHFFDELLQRPSWPATALRSLAFLVLLLLLKLRGVRIVWTAHNIEPHECYHTDWAFLIYRVLARRADAVIVHSHAAHEMLAQRHAPLAPTNVIPIGNYIGLYGPPLDRATCRAMLGLPADGPVLLCIGALRPYKHVEALIDAFAALPEGRRGTLLIAGAAKSAAYAAELRQRAEHVAGLRLQIGYIADSEFPRYLAAADIVVLPYRKMLTSAMLMCALSYGRPVIAPQLGPVRELVQEGREGFLFEPGDQESLKQALERALAHPDLDALGWQGLAAMRALDWGMISATTAACYRRVAR